MITTTEGAAIVCDKCGASRPAKSEEDAKQRIEAGVKAGRLEIRSGKLHCTVCLALEGKWGDEAKKNAERVSRVMAARK